MIIWIILAVLASLSGLAVIRRLRKKKNEDLSIFDYIVFVVGVILWFGWITGISLSLVWARWS